MRIGLTGGIGCGKSTVLQIFAEHGYHAYSADSICHEAYLETAIVDALLERWGKRILGEDGRPERRRIAGIVFEESVELEFLTGLLHPYLKQRLAELLAAEQQGGYPAIFEVPLLFEVGWEAMFDCTVAVWSTPAVRYARLAERGWSPDETARREQAQLSADDKLEKADIGIINNGTRDELLRQCRLLIG
ncbi:dephospho-CoA kinase [Victivallis sp. Marseille-Q1083]|uniref:dephospho-CoA kinase n=1 Tax=Victivallis sp. Marseille-Q1083 TaxID=2717288 RepID=UPI00158BFAB6|nr:dephospho-CoA kinase [Victivallis sp. Marseille-Q1083]